MSFRDAPGPSRSQSKSHRYGPYARQSRSSSSHSENGYERKRDTDRSQPDSYPSALTRLFGPLECRLCGVEATTPIVAKMHYGGKQHKKRVKQFLIEWCQKTGERMPYIEPVSAPTISKRSALPDYCKICDVRLISDSDKLQHFSGKTHQKNLMDPTKRKKKNQDTFDSTLCWDTGSSFSTGATATITDPDKEVDPDDFTCHLCNVRTVSIEQLQIHLGGKKHKLMEEKKTAEPDPYFCEPCKQYCTSFEHYNVHIKGKKHEKKCNEVLRKPGETKTEKCSLVCESCPFVGNIDEHDCDMSLAKLTPEDLKDKVICLQCYNMPFDTEQDYKIHLNSRRHILTSLNADSGDEIVEELIEYYCKVCKKQYEDNTTYVRHLVEETHMTKSYNQSTDLETTALFHCSVCKIMIDAEGYDEHMRNKKHLKQALVNDTLKTIQKLSHENITTSCFRCKNCHLTVYSFVEYTGHLLSEEHLDSMITAKLDGTI